MTSQNTYDNSLSFSQICGFYTVVGKRRHSTSPKGLCTWQPGSAVPYHESGMSHFQTFTPQYP